MKYVSLINSGPYTKGEKYNCEFREFDVVVYSNCSVNIYAGYHIILGDVDHFSFDYFNRCFISISEYRNNKIEEILQ